MLSEGWLWRGWFHWVGVTRAMIEHELSHIKPTQRKIAAHRDRKRALAVAVPPTTEASPTTSSSAVTWEWRDPYECCTWRPFSNAVSGQLEAARRNNKTQMSLHTHMGVHVGIGVNTGDTLQGKAEQCTVFLKAKHMTNIDQQMNYKVRRRKKS